MVKRINGALEQYDFEIGLLSDGPYYLPQEPEDIFTDGDSSMSSAIKNYAGGPVRAKSRERGGELSEVAKAMGEHLGGDYLRDPFFNNNSNRDITRFLGEFFKYHFGKSQKRRLENLLQAVVRNPILRQDYGENSPATVKRKGFDRLGFDTGQWFQNIKAKVTKRNR